MEHKNVKVAYLHLNNFYQIGVKVSGDDEAACKAVERDAYAFTVQTQDEVTEIVPTSEGPKEKFVQAEILEETPRRYIVDRVYTATEAFTKLAQTLEALEPDENPSSIHFAPLRGTVKALEAIAEVETKLSISIPCIFGPFSRAANPDLRWIHEGEKVYNKNAQQIWPEPKAPVPEI